MKPHSFYICCVSFVMCVTTGCSQVRQLIPGQSNQIPIRESARIRVAHWLGNSQEVSLVGERESLGSILSRTDSSSRRIQRDTLQQVAIEKFNTLNVGGRTGDENAAKDKLGLLKQVVKEDMIKISRGPRDWIIPAQLLAQPGISAIKLVGGDSVTTHPLRASVFFQPISKGERPDESVDIILTGPLAAKQGKVSISKGAAGEPVNLTAVVNLRPVPPTKEFQFLLDPESKSRKPETEYLSNSKLADFVVISRVTSTGRIASLLLPRLSISDPLSSFVQNYSGENYRLLDGDVVEITNLELLISQNF